MKKINIDRHTKGIIVYAKSNNVNYNDWLVLVSYVTNSMYTHNELRFYGYIFYDCKRGTWFFYENEPRPWGDTGYWEFYEATNEQKQIIINELKRRGFKYVPILDKLIQKK
jgi:hypothetical protein